MQTIAILPEPTADSLSYSATCGHHQATGQASDTLEAQLATTDSGETLVILQRFRPDDLFTSAQQQRLRELTDRFQTAMTSGRSETIAQGTQLEPTVQSELDTLVEAELEANIQRSRRHLQQRLPQVKQMQPEQVDWVESLQVGRERSVRQLMQSRTNTTQLEQ